MKENEQIEELAAIICTHLRSDSVSRTLASLLYAEGLRKQSEGEWLTDRFGLERSICSVCGAVFEGDGGNYCPNCGAKMKGE